MPSADNADRIKALADLLADEFDEEDDIFGSVRDKRNVFERRRGGEEEDRERVADNNSNRAPKKLGKCPTKRQPWAPPPKKEKLDDDPLEGKEPPRQSFPKRKVAVVASSNVPSRKEFAEIPGEGGAGLTPAVGNPRPRSDRTADAKLDRYPDEATEPEKTARMIPSSSSSSLGDFIQDRNGITDPIGKAADGDHSCTSTNEDGCSAGGSSADADTATSSCVFGHPTTFGAAGMGGERYMPDVRERAAAIDVWKATKKIRDQMAFDEDGRTRAMEWQRIVDDKEGKMAKKVHGEHRGVPSVTFDVDEGTANALLGDGAMNKIKKKKKKNDNNAPPSFLAHFEPTGERKIVEASSDPRGGVSARFERQEETQYLDGPRNGKGGTDEKASHHNLSSLLRVQSVQTEGLEGPASQDKKEDGAKKDEINEKAPPYNSSALLKVEPVHPEGWEGPASPDKKEDATAKTENEGYDSWGSGVKKEKNARRPGFSSRPDQRRHEDHEGENYVNGVPTTPRRSPSASSPRNGILSPRNTITVVSSSPSSSSKRGQRSPRNAAVFGFGQNLVTMTTTSSPRNQKVDGGNKDGKVHSQIIETINNNAPGSSNQFDDAPTEQQRRRRTKVCHPSPRASASPRGRSRPPMSPRFPPASAGRKATTTSMNGSGDGGKTPRDDGTPVECADDSQNSFFRTDDEATDGGFFRTDDEAAPSLVVGPPAAPRTKATHGGETETTHAPLPSPDDRGVGNIGSDAAEGWTEGEDRADIVAEAANCPAEPMPSAKRTVHKLVGDSARSARREDEEEEPAASIGRGLLARRRGSALPTVQDDDGLHQLHVETPREEGCDDDDDCVNRDTTEQRGPRTMTPVSRVMEEAMNFLRTPRGRHIRVDSVNYDQADYPFVGIRVDGDDDDGGGYGGKRERQRTTMITDEDCEDELEIAHQLAMALDRFLIEGSDGGGGGSRAESPDEEYGDDEEDAMRLAMELNKFIVDDDDDGHDDTTELDVGLGCTINRLATAVTDGFSVERNESEESNIDNGGWEGWVETPRNVVPIEAEEIRDNFSFPVSFNSPGNFAGGGSAAGDDSARIEASTAGPSSNDPNGATFFPTSFHPQQPSSHPSPTRDRRSNNLSVATTFTASATVEYVKKAPKIRITIGGAPELKTMEKEEAEEEQMFFVSQLSTRCGDDAHLLGGQSSSMPQTPVTASSSSENASALLATSGKVVRGIGNRTKRLNFKKFATTPAKCEVSEKGRGHNNSTSTKGSLPVVTNSPDKSTDTDQNVSGVNSNTFRHHREEEVVEGQFFTAPATAPKMDAYHQIIISQLDKVILPTSSPSPLVCASKSSSAFKTINRGMNDGSGNNSEASLGFGSAKKARNLLKRIKKTHIVAGRNRKDAAVFGSLNDDF